MILIIPLLLVAKIFSCILEGDENDEEKVDLKNCNFLQLFAWDDERKGRGKLYGRCEERWNSLLEVSFLISVLVIEIDWKMEQGESEKWNY